MNNIYDYLIDTNYISALWDENHKSHEKIKIFTESKNYSHYLISTISVGEILFGQEFNKDKLHSSIILEKRAKIREKIKEHYGYIVKIDRHVSEEYSKIKAALLKKHRRKGRKLKTEYITEELYTENREPAEIIGVQENDLWIAATALCYNYILITDDKMAKIEETISELYPDFKMVHL
ncbi:MAG: PIN domain-containing protein [Firmicutes bacterium]|nr:PIN domain-containing protein [Bacillota bacterium]